MILCPIAIETCFAFESQGNKLKRSIGPSSLTCFHARGKNLHWRFLLPKVIKYGDGQVAFVLAFMPPVFDSRLSFWANCFAF